MAELDKSYRVILECKGQENRILNTYSEDEAMRFIREHLAEVKSGNCTLMIIENDAEKPNRSWIQTFKYTLGKDGALERALY